MDITGSTERRADPARRRLRRRVHRHLFRAGHHRGAEGARDTGKGSHIDMALLDTMVGVLANQAHLLSRLRRAAGADGQRARQRGAIPDLPDHRRLDADRLRQRRPVREDDAGAGRSRHGAGRALQDQRRARGQPRHADPAAVRADEEALQAGACRKIRGGRRAGRTDQHAPRGVQRRAGDLARHAGRPAASRRQGRQIPGVRTPITINGRRAAANRAPPKVGEHTDEVLREIGEA